MFLSKKYFIYYHRVSTQEGLNIDLNTSEFMLGNYNKEIYQKCKYCHCVIDKKKTVLKKILLFAISVLNLYKMIIKLIKI